MRITLIGQAAFGEKVLQRLLERGHDVIGVYTPPDLPGKADPLKESAAKQGLPVFQPKRWRDPDVHSTYAGLAPDLGVMAFVNDIVPERILNCPKRGTIQYHPSLLPRHRGGTAMNWAIIGGETTTGITIFWPDKGIDTGPILCQKKAEISPDDTVGSLYFNKLFPLGVEAMMESIQLIEAGTAPRLAQDESDTTYEGRCEEKDAGIDWSQPAPKVYNLIRGTNPQPGATTFFHGKRLKVFDSQLLAAHMDKPPGEVVGIAEQGIAVAARGGAILIKRVQQGPAKTNAIEYARSSGMKIGDRLEAAR